MSLLQPSKLPLLPAVTYNTAWLSMDAHTDEDRSESFLASHNYPARLKGTSKNSSSARADQRDPLQQMEWMGPKATPGPIFRGALK